MGERRAEAYEDAVHHLAHLASEDAKPWTPNTAAERLAHIAMHTDAAVHSAEPREYVQAARDLLWLAQHDADERGERRLASTVMKAINMLEGL